MEPQQPATAQAVTSELRDSRHLWHEGDAGYTAVARNCSLFSLVIKSVTAVKFFYMTCWQKSLESGGSTVVSLLSVLPSVSD